MMKKLGKILAGVAMMMAMALGVTNSATWAVSCPAGSERSSANSYAECNMPQDADREDIWTVVQRIINLIIGALGIVTVLVIVVGGVQYVTSQGEPMRIKKAKDTIMYGIIGLVVALLAYAIVNFVLTNVFGSSSQSSDDNNNNNNNTSALMVEVA